VDYDQAAYDRMAYMSLRPELYFDGVADVQPTAQAMPGSSVVFTIQADLAAASTHPQRNPSTLTPSPSPTSQVTLTLAEYGNAVITTGKLRGTSFIDINPLRRERGRVQRRHLPSTLSPATC